MKEEIDAAARSAIAKRPVLEEMLNAFATFFTEKAQLVEELKPETMDAGFAPSAEPVKQGIPMCAEVSFDPLAPALNRAFASLLSVIRTSFPAMDQEISWLKTAWKSKSPDLSILAKSRLAGDPKPLEACSHCLGVTAGILDFALGMAVSTVLESLEPALAEKIRAISWKGGFCPICGSLPCVSYLSKEDLGSEYLKGGGGKKFLHCSVCGHQWRIKRNLCPACGTDDKDHLIYFNVEEDSSERVDICRRCAMYLPCIDLRTIDFEPHMGMAAAGMVHLDAYAQQRGYTPMVWTPWNRLEDGRKEIPQTQ